MIRQSKSLFSFYRNLQIPLESNFSFINSTTTISACSNSLHTSPVTEATSLLKRKPPIFHIVPITAADTDTVLDLLRKSFFLDEPMTKAVGLSCNVPKVLEDHCVECLSEGLSLMALDVNKKPIAVALNATSHPGEGKLLLKISKHIKCEKTRALFKFWADLELQSRIWQRLSVSHIWEVRILATSQVARSFGLSKILLERSIQMARDQGYPLVRMDCTSRYSAKAAESLDFYCLHTIFYKDYLGLDKKPVVEPSGPHTCFKMYVLPLEDGQQASG